MQHGGIDLLFFDLITMQRTIQLNVNLTGYGGSKKTLKNEQKYNSIMLGLSGALFFPAIISNASAGIFDESELNDRVRALSRGLFLLNTASCKVGNCRHSEKK